MSGGLRHLLRVASWAIFLRFAAVGAIGFVVDAGVLLALVALGWASPIEGRLISFACAVLVTFELNRRWSFGRMSRRPYLATLASYVGVQSGGFLCNLWLCYRMLAHL